MQLKPVWPPKHGPMALVAVVVLVASVALSVLFQSASDHHNHALVARRLQTLVASINAQEWTARAVGVTPEVAETIDRDLAQSKALLVEADMSDRVASPIELTFAAYRDALTAEIALLRSHDLIKAVAMDRELVDPAFDALNSALDTHAVNDTRAAASALRTLRIGSLAVLLAAGMLIALIFTRAARRRLHVIELQERAQVTMESEQRLRALAQNTADGIMLVTDEGAVLFATAPVATMLGTVENDIVDRSLADLTRGAPGPSSVVSRARADESGLASAEWHLIGDDGRERIFEIIANARYEGGPEGAVLLTLRDMTDHKLLERLLSHRARHDPLTGLANRDELVQAIDEALAHPVAPTGALVFVDLDDFKNVNDTLGHAFGDELLRAVAERLRHAVEPGGMTARLGGDEFAVLITNVADRAAAVAQAEKMLATFAQPYLVDGFELRQDASLGIAVIDASGPVRATDLLRAADIAMYDAKLAGKNRIGVFSDEMQQQVRKSVQLRIDLARAVREGLLEVAYQPIIALDRGGAVTGLEALARWNHPTEGSIAPAVFIPVAEQSDLICDIDRFVLNAACQAAAWWRATLGADYPVSVNLSARHFDADLVGDVAAALAAADLPARLLKIEITESALRGRERAVVVMHRLKAIGVHASLDDFGIEYSALAYVRDFPLDELKIDRSFIRDMDTESGRQFVKTIIDLARMLKVSAVAEGIETEEQADVLRSQGCILGQGFLYARPLAADDVVPHLLAVAEAEPACA